MRQVGASRPIDNIKFEAKNREVRELSLLRDHYTDLARQARADVRGGLQDTGTGVNG